MDIQELRKLKENSYRYFTKEDSLEAVRKDGYSLRYVKKQDKDICLEAVKQNGDSLQYVKKQDKEICLEAVRQDGYSLQYVNPSIFDDMQEEMTLEEIEEELGKKIKIITKK